LVRKSAEKPNVVQSVATFFSSWEDVSSLMLLVENRRDRRLLLLLSSRESSLPPPPGVLADNLDDDGVWTAKVLDVGDTKAETDDEQQQPVAMERAVAASNIADDDEVEDVLIIDRDRFPVFMFGGIIIFASRNDIKNDTYYNNRSSRK
jgi:hypothetical protein